MGESNLRGDSHSFSLRRCLNPVKSAFFLTFADICPALKPTKAKSSSYRRLYRLSFQALHLLNLLSIAFPLSLHTPGFSPDFPLWKIFTYSRFDAVLVAMGSEESALILAYCFTFVPLTVLVLTIALRLALPSLKASALKLLLRASLRLLNEAFIIPTAMVLWTTSASVLFGLGVEHVYVASEGSAMSSPAHCVLSLLALVSLVGLLLVQREMLFDICWLNGSSNIFARYSASVHTQAVYCNVLLCCATSLWHSGYFRTQSLLSISLSAYICFKFTSVMPFYNRVVAIAIPCKYLILCLAVCQRLFAEYLESENTAWTLLICLLPADVLLYYQVYRLRYRLVDPHNPDWTVCDFQLLVIQILTADEKTHSHSDMQQLFHKAKVKFPAEAQIPLFESLYYLFERKNVEVAQLKASLSPPGSLQSTFLRFRMIHYFHAVSTHEKHQYVFFNSVYENVQKCDEYFCYRFGEFLSEVSSWQQSDLTKSCESFSGALGTLEKQYVSLLTEFPRDVTVLTLFSGFLKDVKRDEERVEDLRKRIDIIQKNGKRGSFDPSMPLFICEAVGERKIILANKAFETMMSYKGGKPVIDDLNGLLPPFARDTHKRNICKVLSASDKTEFSHEDVFLIKTGIIGVLVKLTAEFLAVSGRAYMFVQVTPREKYLEFALVRDGFLVVCTDDFLSVIGASGTPTSPIPIADVMPGYEAEKESMQVQYRGLVEVAKRDVRMGDLEFTMLETLNYNLRTRSRKHSVAPSFPSSPPRADVSKPLETHDYEVTSTKAFTSHHQHARDHHRLRKREVLRLSKYLLLIIAAQIVLLIMESFIMFAFYFQVVDEMDAVDTINELGLRRFYNVRIVGYVRQLELLQAGISLVDTESFIRANLQAAIDSYSLVLSHIRDNSTQWMSGPCKDLYYESVVPVWILTNSNVAMAKVSLFDAMANFLLRAQSVMESELGKVRSEDFFYVYANGLGETFDYLNRSTFMFIEEKQSEQLEKIALIFYFSAFMVIGISLSGSFMLFFVIVKLEKKYSECWSIISSASTSTIQRLWEIVRNRLDTIHGVDAAPQIPPRKHKFIKKFTRRYQKLVFVLCGFAVGSIGYFLYVYLTASEYVSIAMVTKANYSNWSGLRRALSSLLSALAVEHYLSTNPTLSYFALIRSGQKLYDFEEMIEKTVADLQFAEKVSIRGDQSKDVFEVDMSAKHHEIMFGSACEIVNVTGCSQTSISKGGHLGLLDFLMLVIAQVEMNDEQLTTLAQVFRLRQVGTPIGVTFTTAAEVYIADCSASLSAFRVLLWTFPGVYLSVAVFLVPALILPIKSRYERSLLAAWRTSAFFLTE